MDEAGLGALSRQDGRWTLRFTRRLAHPREKVWRAVTEPEQLAVWYPQQIVGERRPTGRLGRGRGQARVRWRLGSLRAGHRQRGGASRKGRSSWRATGKAG